MTNATAVVLSHDLRGLSVSEGSMSWSEGGVRRAELIDVATGRSIAA